MADTKRRTGGRGRRRWVLALGLGIFLCGWLVWSLRTFAIPNRMYVIPSASMAPTIRFGDRIAVAANGSTRPKRGEIWVFRMPLHSGQAPNQAVKRVIGLPGETIEVKGGRVLVDGRPLAEPYLSTPISYTMGPLTLAEDEYCVLGDNRNGSLDSHVWGPLPGDHLVGPVKVRVWPVGRIGGF